ncbi:MAG: O-phosphoserine--tRNA ligase [Candidatus Methanofastidiosa archaeon]|nr:O-phosphoserine--tRNA ligase [Candidatus Methanofastidiosa archaeon]
MLPLEDILQRSKKDYFSVWKETGTYFEGSRTFELPPRRGREHLISRYALKARDILLDMGFDEVYLKQFFTKDHVEKQYGPESPAILDRLFFLATLPRPDIGIADDRRARIQELIPSLDFDKLKAVFRDYKLDKIDPGDLSEELATRLKVAPEDAMFLLKEAFPEVLDLKPVSTDLVLNSHFTTAWFPTVAQLVGKSPLPVMLFTSGWRYRREQREDPMHLRAHYNLSMVIMQEGFTIQDGMYVTKEFFSRFGFDKLKFKKKPNQAIYYAYDTNYEVFIKDDRFGWVEITEIGMYSPIALAHYGIPYPVFNSGPGLGRLVMLKEDVSDLRQLHHPEFFSFSFTDTEIASSLSLVESPPNKALEPFIESVLAAARSHRDDESPCSVTAFDGEILGRRVVARITEREEHKHLLGPAAFNALYVHEGSIYGIPPEGLSEAHATIVAKGVPTGITYAGAFLAKVAKDLQAALVAGEAGPREYRFGMAKRLSDVNLSLPEEVRTFIQMKNNKIDVRGPVFFSLEVEIAP